MAREKNLRGREPFLETEEESLKRIEAPEEERRRLEEEYRRLEEKNRRLKEERRRLVAGLLMMRFIRIGVESGAISPPNGLRLIGMTLEALKDIYP